MMKNEAITDLVALQELHDDSLAAAFSNAFSSTHDFLHTSKLQRGRYFFWAWRGCLFGSVMAMSMMALSSASASSASASASAVFFLAGLATIFALTAVAFIMPVRCTAAQFLLSSTVGGLGLLVNRSKWRVLAFETRFFTHQAGDWLNHFKPRAFAVALLEERGGASPRARLLVLHAHASLGVDEHRGLQISETVAAASPAAVAAMLERTRASAADPSADADDGGAPPDSSTPLACIFLGDLNATYDDCVGRVVEPAGFTDAFAAGKGCPNAKSWDNCNPLASGGLLKVPCARVDHILARKGPGLGEPCAARVMYNEPPYLSDHYAVRVDFIATNDDVAIATPYLPRCVIARLVSDSVSSSGSVTPEPAPFSASTSMSCFASFDEAEGDGDGDGGDPRAYLRQGRRSGFAKRSVA